MRRALPIFAAILFATIVGTLAEGISSNVILGILSFDPRAEAVVHFFGRLVSALAAIGAFIYYEKRIPSE